ncbi:toll/interleukin-1 receptor domain-containing protein [Methylobacterium sp. J-067]|uniref:toll/interleukin-1 receptor domain-containing protein n=1 Tax=Methylobacterium sp. J-067 TaxID=2836648 RepID=UPI001FB877BC|nr:toll/interleukin-1 receptor domain-containing protein [Methylobacterium sp. J-067]MCJ2023635.1 toll/interleukin-1 receptor domain-containing protein [Methylobacterium sp. J-067]
MATPNRTRTAKDPLYGKPKAAAYKVRATANADSRTPMGKPEVRIFVSYSHVDAVARQKLETHLAPLLKDGVKTWFDGRMDPGDALDASISKALREAHVMIALLSPEYISSRYCQLEYDRAMGRRARGTIRVVGVVVRPCSWKETKAAGFKLLPEDGRTVQDWRSADAAYLNVAQGIGKLVKTLRAGMAVSLAKPSAHPPKSRTPVKTPSASPGTKSPARSPVKAVRRKSAPKITGVVPGRTALPKPPRKPEVAGRSNSKSG